MDSHIYKLKGHQLWFDFCHYWPAYISHILGKIAYAYQLEGHKPKFSFCHCCRPTYKNDTFQAGVDNWCSWTSENNFRHFLAFLVLLPSHQVNYELILIIINRKIMLHNKPMQILINIPWLPNSMIHNLEF